MIILGIDPGSRCSGFAVIQWHSLQADILELGFWRPSCQHTACRIRELYDTVEWWLQTYRPENVAVEVPFVHPRNPRSAIVLYRVLHVIQTALARNGYPWAEYSATQVKRYITGSGRAEKRSVRRYLYHMIPECRRWAHMPEDAFDALAVAMCHSVYDISGIVPVQTHTCASHREGP